MMKSYINHLGIQYENDTRISDDTCIPDISSFFIEDVAIFGAWPTQTQVEKLEKWGVDIFINLASDLEKRTVPYFTTKQVIKFPIPDRSIPPDKLQFCILIIKICEMIDDGKKIYIHCKGGHGRSGILVASILAYRYKTDPGRAIFHTSECHSDRVELKSKWRYIGSPQTIAQKQFVTDLFITHEIGKDSPFYSICNTENMETHLKIFLLHTYFGNIVGMGGETMMKYRMFLFKNFDEIF